MQRSDIAIIGAGIMGVSAACELARKGARVVVIDQAHLPNPRAASVDHSKVFRFAYPDPLYAKLAVDALARWRALELRTGAKLHTQTGALLIARSDQSIEAEYYKTLRSLGLECDKLDSRLVSAHFPQFNSRAFAYGVYDPSGAILHAEGAVRALIKLAIASGVRFVEGERVVELKQGKWSSLTITSESGHKVECERAMVSSGPWSRILLPLLAKKLTTTRQELVYFEPKPGQNRVSFEPDSFPIFLELDSGFYGFPIHHNGAMKIANHHKGVEIDPNGDPQQVGEDFIKRCREFFAQFIPALEDATVSETNICYYNNTPDDDFIIDWHPEMSGILIVTGFSGHGFKFGPTIGRIAADLLLQGEASFNIDRFGIKRFNNIEEKI